MKLIKYILGSVFLPLIGCADQIVLEKVSDGLIYDNPPFAQCHASTIMEVSPNKFMVAAFGGAEEGNKDVCIWLSTKGDDKWGKPVQIADGIINDSLRYPTWNPVLFKARESKVFLFYKVGPSPREWWGMVRTSDDNGKTWSSSKRLAKGILGPIKNKPVQLANGTILSPSSTETEDSWKVHIEKSTDLGKTWQLIPIDQETPYQVIQPSILEYPDKMQILCRSKDNAVIQSYSKDNGNTWGTLTKTELPNPNAGTDALTLDNGWQLLVYNPTVQGKDGRAKLNVAASKDGIAWSDVFVLEDQDYGEFSYPAVVGSNDGNIHITYTYNRVNVKHVVLRITR